MVSNIGRSAAQKLQEAYPWTSLPLIVGAPMRIISGPPLAIAICNAGGLGFIGPGARPADLDKTLTQTSSLLEAPPLSSPLRHPQIALLRQRNPFLPVGVGFQTWAGDLATTTRIMGAHPPPAAAWLFAPRHGQQELDEWASGIRSATKHATKIWIQITSVKEAEAAAASKERPDVLVVQGHDAGGHSLTKGAGIMTLLPEVADALSQNLPDDQQIPLVAAGGIIDARGVVAAAALGAAGSALGTRFLASDEANISSGYMRHVLAASDGGQTTVRTQLYNHLRGTMDWPSAYDARGLANASWKDHGDGVSFEVLKERHEEAVKKGEDAWGEEEGRVATYAGTGVGLVREKMGASSIVDEIRQAGKEILEKVRKSSALTK